MTVLSVVTTTLDSIRWYAGSLAWGPLVRISRTVILSLLGRIEKGILVIRENDGIETVCGSSLSKIETGPRIELRVHRESFWVRLLLFADMVRLSSVNAAGDNANRQRVSRRATCSARCRVQILLLSSRCDCSTRSVKMVKLNALPMLVVHCQSKSALQCDNPRLLRIHHDQWPPPSNKHHVKCTLKRQRTL
jgi:hypothetical protein